MFSTPEQAGASAPDQYENNNYKSSDLHAYGDEVGNGTDDGSYQDGSYADATDGEGTSYLSTSGDEVEELPADDSSNSSDSNTSSASSSSSSSSKSSSASSSSKSSSAASSSQADGKGYVGAWYALNGDYVQEIGDEFTAASEEKRMVSNATMGLVGVVAVAAVLAAICFLRMRSLGKKISSRKNR